MMPNGYLQLAVYILVLLALAKPLGAYMARVYEGKPLMLERPLGWLERLIYRTGRAMSSRWCSSTWSAS
jgi:potassium-transporting ATPase potassium-binding subunit